MKQKKILICGAGGFIGTHLVTKLKSQGHFVVGVDIKHNKFYKSDADFFIIQDLTNQLATYHIFKNFQFDEVYCLAAVMGGMEYLANGEHDYDVLNQSSLICMNVIESCIQTEVDKVFFSSSACIYPEHLQMETAVTALCESVAYPAAPDLEYGYQKLITERLYMAAERCNNIQVRIARFHNIFGLYTEYTGEKAKAPAALCRKVAKAYGIQDNLNHLKHDARSISSPRIHSIEVFGDGLQTRSFTYIDECIEGILRLMESDCNDPINIGSSELIAINDLTQMIIDISGKNLAINNIPGPQGVRGRNSDNTLIQEKLNWKPTQALRTGIEKLYEWVNQEITKTKNI